MIGDKKIDTKTRYVSSGKVIFNERFAMKTILNYDAVEDTYEQKPVNEISLYMLPFSHSCKYLKASRN